MIKVTLEKWERICDDYKGYWMNYHNDHPEWIGRRVVMSACVGAEPGKLLIEGVHFEII